MSAGDKKRFPLTRICVTQMNEKLLKDQNSFREKLKEIEDRYSVPFCTYTHELKAIPLFALIYHIMTSQVSSNYLTFRERSTLKAKDERIHDLEEEVNLNGT